MKKSRLKLRLRRETLQQLDPAAMKPVHGGQSEVEPCFFIDEAPESQGIECPTTIPSGAIICTSSTVTG